ncbi:MAG TPA: hypothetical protein VN634_21800 [Candidatus Limnocylindrales bacterium]|nr:hypothetical protein [Candidatus Limnocylindrales bacterium]
MNPQDSSQAFAAFAEAFEVGFASRDWTPVDRMMTDDVVWSLAELPPPVGGTHVGRQQAIDAIRLSTDTFDRRFDRREPVITDGPREIPGGIHMTWAVTYTRDGLPPFVLLGEEWDLFRDGKLEVHRERVHNLAEMWTYVANHNDRLAPVAP